MNDMSRIRQAFLEEFEAMRSALEAALAEPSQAAMNHALEVVHERHGPLDALGYLRAGYGLGVLDVLQHLDMGEALIDRVLERAWGLVN